MGDFIDEDLLKDWFEEANQQVENIESNLLILENDTSNQEAIDAIFRAAHTLKGGSATVQMDEISTFTHTLEDAMDEIRKGKVKVDSEIVDTLLDALDIIKNMIQARSNGEIYKGNYKKTIDQLKAIEGRGSGSSKSSNSGDSNAKSNQSKNSTASTQTVTGNSNQDKGHKITEYEMLEIRQSNTDGLPLYKIVVTFDENNPMRTVGGIQVFTALRDIGQVLKTFPDFDDLYSEDFHKIVTYILATNVDQNTILKYTTISDTTTDIFITPLDGQTTSKGDFFQPQSQTQTSQSQSNVKNQYYDTGSQKIDKKDLDIDERVKSIVNENNFSQENRTGKNQEKNFVEEVNEEISNEQSSKKESSPQKDSKLTTTSVLRVDSSRIDDLLNLVSEIVINKATFNQISTHFFDNLESLNYAMSYYKDKIKQIADNFFQKDRQEKSLVQMKKDFLKEFANITNNFDQFATQYRSIIEKFKTTTQNLDRISSDLREGVMRVRMIQIKQIFSRFPRLVRDLSRELKKEVELVMEGEETEVDKAMLDDLIDPLIHMVRNAIDHGFETPEERIKLGKKNPGTLKLKAINEGNLISIYISDNGRGIDVEKVRRKAIANGLIPEDKVMREQDIYALLFEPGFSTADKVTSVSGRGVGLDVVKRNIEKLSGSIRVTSTPGKGTTFAIKLPLTLAIIQGLMVRVQEEIYALPISSVLESIRITSKDIKSIDSYEVINVRDDVLSLLRLNRLFKLGNDVEQDFYYVVIVGVGDKKIGLLVDSLIGEEDIVIKPLKDKYTSTPGIAGATVLGDGTVSLILDVSQLIDLGLKQEIENYQNREYTRNIGGRK